MKDILIKNIALLSNDGVIENTNIVVDKGLIDYIGTDEKQTNEKFKENIDGKNMIASAGLVNAHCHSSMVLFRNYADDMALYKWLFEKIIPAENKLDKNAIYWGSKLAVAEMIQSGTTAFMDMYLDMDAIAEVVTETGIKACLSKDILKSHVRGDGIVLDEEGFKNYYEKWNGAEELINVNLEIHSVYLYDEPSLRKAGEFAKNNNLGIHIHLLESKDEVKQSIEMYGKNSLKAAKDFGLLDVPITAAHCIHLDETDMDIIKEKNVSVVHCPSSNLKLASGIAQIPKMLENEINVCLGTDGAASNNNLNMMEEMHITSLLHKGVYDNPEILKANEVYNMATKNGAKALGLDNTGELAVGKKADIILIDTNSPHLQPMRHHMSALIYSAQASDVDTSIVNGKILMNKKELKTIDLEEVYYNINKIIETIK